MTKTNIVHMDELESERFEKNDRTLLTNHKLDVVLNFFYFAFDLFFEDTVELFFKRVEM